MRGCPEEPASFVIGALMDGDLIVQKPVGGCHEGIFESRLEICCVNLIVQKPVGD